MKTLKTLRQNTDENMFLAIGTTGVMNANSILIFNQEEQSLRIKVSSAKKRKDMCTLWRKGQTPLNPLPKKFQTRRESDKTIAEGTKKGITAIAEKKVMQTGLVTMKGENKIVAKKAFLTKEVHKLLSLKN